MRARLVPPLLVAALAAVLLSGCGDAARRVSADAGVIAPELRVVEAVPDCDQGKRAYCGSDLIVVARRRTKSSYRLRAAESRAIARAHWKRVAGQARKQLAAASPDGKVYLSYSTARDELRAVRDGYVKRPKRILQALRRAVAHRRAMLSIALSPGP